MVQYAAGNLPRASSSASGILPELRRIEVLPDEIRIGAGCTYTDLRESEFIAREFPLARERRKLDRRNREPESRHARRQYRQRVARGRFAARAARL